MFRSPTLFVCARRFRAFFLIAASVMAFATAIAAQEIKFGPLYNCPPSSLYNFKVLSCDGNDCNVFFKNNSPEGGFTGEVSKSRIAAAFRAGGCTADGAPLKAAALPGTVDKTTRNTPAKPDDKVAATPAGSCIGDVPAEVATKAAAPSPALIKRVIYERYRDMESGRRVGIAFRSLVLATSFVNRLTAGGLLHGSAPVGAKIYRYKTDFSTCVAYTDSILKTDVKEGYFRCFRDRTGEWVCADDGRRSWDQTYLPVK